MNGFIVIDKDGGMTSHDVVAKVRKVLGTKRVGHAGTLDPMATGVLVIGVGNATKLLQYIVDGRKRYEATIRFGVTTVSDDREGEVLSTKDTAEISDERIRIALSTFVGSIMQRPSSVSAIKVGGKRAYDLVRSGEKVELPAREVYIEAIEVRDIRRGENLDVDISVTCGAGTYIRAIARDAGELLGVGGHLIALRRTEVSPFTLADAVSLNAELTPIDTFAAISKVLPARTLSLDEVREISFGRPIDASGGDGIYAAADAQGRFAALLENRQAGDRQMAFPTLVAVKE